MRAPELPPGGLVSTGTPRRGAGPDGPGVFSFPDEGPKDSTGPTKPSQLQRRTSHLQWENSNSKPVADVVFPTGKVHILLPINWPRLPEPQLSDTA